MRSFKDATGDLWEFSITLGLRQKIISRLGFDFVSEAGKDVGELIQSLVFDLGRFLDILEIALEPKMQERGIDLQGLADRLDGEALDRAQVAVVEGFCDFFRQSRRCHRETALRESLNNLTAAVETVSTKIEQSGKEFRTLIESSTN